MMEDRHRMNTSVVFDYVMCVMVYVAFHKASEEILGQKMDNYRISGTIFLQQNWPFQVTKEPHLWEVFKKGSGRCLERTKVGKIPPWLERQSNLSITNPCSGPSSEKSQLSDKPRLGMASLYDFRWGTTQENSCVSPYTKKIWVSFNSLWASRMNFY